jgi:hypothetical protein
LFCCGGLDLWRKRDFPAGKLTPTERLKTAHLKAAHEDAERLQQTRTVPPPPLPGLRFQSILHAHAEDSTHTGGTSEMLADARRRACGHHADGSFAPAA